MSSHNTPVLPVAKSFRLKLDLGLIQLLTPLFVFPLIGRQLAALVLVLLLQRTHLLLDSADLLSLTLQLSLSLQGLRRRWKKMQKQFVFRLTSIQLCRSIIKMSESKDSGCSAAYWFSAEAIFFKGNVNEFESQLNGGNDDKSFSL